MYKNVSCLFLMAILLAGCRPPATTNPIDSPVVGTPTAIPPTLTPIPPTLKTTPPITVPTALPTSTTTTAVSYGSLNMILPVGLASRIRGSKLPRADSPNLPVWEWTPGHTQIKLEGYLLQEKSLEPQIYIYPAQAYAEMKTGAFESIRRLDNIFGSPGASITSDQLPGVPFFNSIQIFGSHIQVIPFQNGQGVRFLTQYAQGIVPINNHELVYTYQGLTRDGAYYIVGIFPINLAGLPDDNKWNGQEPPAGSDYRKYIDGVVNKLHQQPASAYSPDLGKLDALIQSIEIR